jgi:hypothetical protein
VDLLRKCCWRLREERNMLWYIVLTERYGEVGGRIGVGGQVRLCLVEKSFGHL